ncbi:MAG: archaemetzincin, partial [Acidobacteriota bacterium]
KYPGYLSNKFILLSDELSMRQSLLSILLLLGFLTFNLDVQAEQVNEKHRTDPLLVYLQPLGKFSGEDLVVFARGIEASFHIKVYIMPSTTLPTRANARGRHRATELLDHLGSQCPQGSKIIGITTADISIVKGVHNDWGVYGLGDLSGPAAIVSSFRIKTDTQLRRLHLLTVIRHELGHTLGLRHCANHNCLMAAGDELSSPPPDFCPRCAATIAPFLKSR